MHVWAKPRHIEAVRNLTCAHPDPFDRLLIAQAQDERLTLLTRDVVGRSWAQLQRAIDPAETVRRDKSAPYAARASSKHTRPSVLLASVSW